MPQSRSCSMLSPTGSLSAPLAALGLQAAGPTHLGSSNSLDSPKGDVALPFKSHASLPGAAAAGSGLTGALSTTKRNSLPPLRSVPLVSGGGQTPTSPNAAATAAAGGLQAAGGPADSRQATVQTADAVAGAPAGLGRSRIGSNSSISAVAHTEATASAAAAALPGPSGQGAAAAMVPHFPADSSRLLRQQSSTPRHSVGSLGGPAGPAGAAGGMAMQQLESVCRAQVELHRCVLQGCKVLRSVCADRLHAGLALAQAGQSILTNNQTET